MSIFKAFKNLQIKNENKSEIDFEDIKINELKIINPVVSYEKLIPLSYWNDIKWDFSLTTNKRKRTIVNFENYKNKLSDNLFEEFKYVVYSLYVSKIIYSTRVEAAAIASSIFIFFELLNKEGLLSIKELEKNGVLNDLLKKIDGVFSFSTLTTKLNYIKDFENLNLKSFNINFGFNNRNRIFNHNKLSIDFLAKKYANQKKIEKEQTLFIPNKIHSKIVFNAIEVINRNYNLLDKISLFLEEEYLTYLNTTNLLDNFKDLEKKQIKSKIRNLRKNKINNISSINDLISKQNFPKRLDNYDKIKEECRLIATSSFILILTFSGMRNNELLEIKKMDIMK